MNHISSKCAKQIALVAKELGPLAIAGNRKFLLGLSLGVSSTALLDLLHENVRRQVTKGHRQPFEVLALHVDTELSSADGASSPAVLDILARHRERYPHFTFESVPVSSALELRTIDWTTLPPLEAGKSTRERIRTLFEQLPSTTSKADITRLLIRHILFARALRDSHNALLLGYSTTSLAALTLAETAKGRGFSLPWQVNDGAVPVLEYDETVREGDGGRVGGKEIGSVLMFYPLRDLLRKELATYAALVSPPLTEIILEAPEKTAAVVSHKDLSIEEVMVRYFSEVELNFPSIVANVAKTTGKLDRVEAAARCGVCSMPLDEQGDERWRGEIGDDGSTPGSVWEKRLCYGCKRTIGG